MDLTGEDEAVLGPEGQALGIALIHRQPQPVISGSGQPGYAVPEDAAAQSTALTVMSRMNRPMKAVPEAG